MKKLLSLALATVMLFMISATVCAQEITESGNVTVTYTSEVTYTVTIPDSMTIGTPAEISVSDVAIGTDQRLNVTVSSNQYNAGWQLSDGTNTVGYTLKINDSYADLVNNGHVLSTTTGVDVEATLHTTIKETPVYSGTFTDTLTFSVNIVRKDITQTEAEELITKCDTLMGYIQADSVLMNEFSNDRSYLMVERDTLDVLVEYYFIEPDGSVTQEEINAQYSTALKEYNELKAKVLA